MPPVINETLCIICNECVDLCPQDVFWGSDPEEAPVVRYGLECWHCGLCEEACPAEGAVVIRFPLPAMVLYK